MRKHHKLKKKSSRRLKKIMLMNTGSYFANSTIHGLKYVYGKDATKIPLSHKVGWGLAIVTSCVVCCWLSLLIRNEFINTHTITAITSNTYHVIKVPFPAIIACNINKVSRKKFQVIRNILLENGIEEEVIENFGTSLGSLISFSTFTYDHRNTTDYGELFAILEKYNLPVDKLMDKVQQDCDKFLYLCFFQGKSVNCSNYFQRIRTSEGYCCAFNYKGVKSFYSNNLHYVPEIIDEPHHLLGYQIYGGVSVVLHIDEKDYMSPIRPLTGVEVLIMDAVDFPDSSVKSSIIQSEGRVLLKVTPSVIESSAGVKRLPAETCLAKCRASAIYDICGCVPFYYPPTELDTRRKCLLSDNKCLAQNKGFFYSLGGNNYSHGLICNCRPECSDRFYKVKSSKGMINHSMYSTFLRRGNNNSDLTSMAVYFPKISCYKYRTDVFMSWNDLIALYGGIINLFIGGSILSALEIIYNLIFKICSRRSSKINTFMTHVHYVE